MLHKWPKKTTKCYRHTSRGSDRCWLSVQLMSVPNTLQQCTTLACGDMPTVNSVKMP